MFLNAVPLFLNDVSRPAYIGLLSINIKIIALSLTIIRGLIQMAPTQAQPNDIISGRDKADDWEIICEVNRRRQSRRGIRE